jgi:hypothetical protein
MAHEIRATLVFANASVSVVSQIDISVVCAKSYKEAVIPVKSET